LRDESRVFDDVDIRELIHGDDGVIIDEITRFITLTERSVMPEWV
jgi:hypothetical protein